ncbi:signal recognition particle subunit srp68 [Chytridiales sp. JEL 0842]|nr:signal recognition particle subunit srp68 [Chytridiales sp. JEL 0842]
MAAPTQISRDLSDMWSLKALRMCVENLPRAYKDPSDHKAQEQMILASTFAGIGFGNAGVHLCHGMSYPIAGLNKGYKHKGYEVDHKIIPHGISVAVTSPAVFNFTAPACPERHLEAAEIFGADIGRVRHEDAGRILSDALRKFLQDLDVPDGIGALGFKKDDVENLVLGTLPQHRVTKLAPNPVGAEELERLFEILMSKGELAFEGFAQICCEKGKEISTMTSLDTTMPDAPALPSSLTLDVLTLTSEARNEHGLRHQDYLRYRTYCARKIRRVKSIVGLSQGKVKKYAPKPVTLENITSSRHLELVLFEAERAWSYAMELKRASGDEPRKRHHSVRRLKRAAQAAETLKSLCEGRGEEVDARTLLDVQAYSALMKGYHLFEKQQWQEALDNFATSRTIYEKLATIGTPQEEALCYSAIDSIDPNIRYCAYNLKLLKGGGDVDISQLVKMKGAEGAGNDLLASKVDELLSKNLQIKAAGIHDVTWRNTSVPSKNEKLIKALVVAQEAMGELEEVLKKGEGIVDENGGLRVEEIDGRLELYAKVIGAYWDATKLAEADLKADEIATSKVASSKSETNTANLQFIASHIAYVRLSKTIERNLLLAEVAQIRLTMQPGSTTTLPKNVEKKPPKPEELVRITDNILKTIQELADLAIVQNDIVLQTVVSSKQTFFQSTRNLHLGRLYLQASKYIEAVVLFDRAAELLTQSRAESSRLISRASGKGSKKGAAASGIPTLADEDKVDLEWLSQEQGRLDSSIRSRKLRAHALLTIQAQKTGTGVVGLSQNISNLDLNDTTTTTVKKTTVYDNLDKFVLDFDPSNPQLIELPPKMQPAPMKPLFFDIAGNSVDYPLTNIRRRLAGKERVAKGLDAMEDVVKSGEGETKEGGSGLAGFLSGIWGRK